MQLLNLTSGVPVYLPYDIAPIPFGDPFNDVTITAAAPGVVSVPGYVATAGDQVMFSTIGANTLASPLVPGTAYFVVSPAGNSFSVAATKGGAAITTTTANAAVNQVVVHLVSNQIDGPLCPFKTGGTAIALNLTAGTVTLQGAPDVAPPTVGNYSPPQGPGTYVQLASLATLTAAVVQLSYDWIKASAGGLILLQN